MQEDINLVLLHLQSTKPTSMRFSVLYTFAEIAGFLSLIGQSFGAEIIGIGAPEFVTVQKPFNVILAVQQSSQPYSAVAVALGVANPGENPPGAIRENIQDKYLAGMLPSFVS